MPKKPEFPRREEFLNAALARFSRAGYSATSTREICADLNIVPSAMYNYFPSKEAVILFRASSRLSDARKKLVNEAATTSSSTAIQAYAKPLSSAIINVAPLVKVCG